MCQTIEEKYNIVYIDKKRYYKEDLTKRDLIIENSTPESFTYRNFKLVGKSWKDMAYNIVKALYSFTNRKHEEFMNFTVDWSKQKVFTDTSNNYNKKIDENLYINLNQNAVHTLWIIQAVLDFFGINKSECELIIKRHGSSEYPDAREYYTNITKAGFREYIKQHKSYDDNKIDIIFKYFDEINKYAKSVSHAYDDLYLFDDGNMFANYKIRLIKYLKDNNIIKDEKKFRFISKCLDYLHNYYYWTYNSTRNIE